MIMVLLALQQPLKLIPRQLAIGENLAHQARADVFAGMHRHNGSATVGMP